MEPREKTILIVEDEADLREALATALSYEGYRVIQAGDGEEGLKKALTEKPNLMLLDIVMPKKDGLEVLRELKDDERAKDIKIIVMTVLDDLEKIAEVVESGGDEYVVKTDITLDGIIKKVRENLEKTI
jgi:DNA-binding response OmpR family regulator